MAKKKKRSKAPVKKKHKTPVKKRWVASVTAPSGKILSGTEINALKNTILYNLERKHGELQIKLLKCTTKADKRKVKKEIAAHLKHYRKVQRTKI